MKMNDFKEELLNKIEHEFWLRDISDQEKVMFALNVIQKLWIDFEGTLTLNGVVVKSTVAKVLNGDDAKKEQRNE